MNVLLLNNYFSIGSLKIYYYALCIVGGILAAAGLSVPLFKKRGYKSDILLDLLIAIIPCSIVFARLWYVVFDLEEFTRGAENVGEFLLAVIDTRSGGMAIYGGVLGGALGIFIISKIKKIPFAAIADVGATMLPLGQAVGRLGNFFNQEVYGSVITDPSLQHFPFAVFIEADGAYHEALCFKEMFFNLIVFALLYAFAMLYNGKRNGYSIGAYFFFYGLIRSIMETQRSEKFNMGTELLGLPLMTWFSILLSACGVAIIVSLVVLDKKSGNEWWKTFFKRNNKKTNANDGEINAADGEK